MNALHPVDWLVSFFWGKEMGEAVQNSLILKRVVPMGSFQLNTE
jgi:hypothetical protein